MIFICYYYEFLKHVSQFRINLSIHGTSWTCSFVRGSILFETQSGTLLLEDQAPFLKIYIGPILVKRFLTWPAKHSELTVVDDDIVKNKTTNRSNKLTWYGNHVAKKVSEIFFLSRFDLIYSSLQITCWPDVSRGHKQCPWRGQAGSSGPCPSLDLTRRWLSDEYFQYMKATLSSEVKPYLGCSTLVPSAVVKDVLPLLQDQEKVKIRSLDKCLLLHLHPGYSSLPGEEHKLWQRRQHQWWNIVSLSPGLS